MPNAAVRVDVRPDAVAVLTIDQPGSKVNVLTPQLWTELELAVEVLAGRPDLRGLVVASGKPGVFVAGADLKLFANAPGTNDPGVRAFIDQGLRVLEKLEALPFPTCAAVDGAALGGGLEIALACDGRLAGSNPKAQLGLPEVRVGLIPGWGGTQRLPRVVGVVDAANLLTGGNGLSARSAQAIGLVAAVVESDRLVDAAAKFVAGRPGWREERARKQQPTAEGWAAYPTLPDQPGVGREAIRVMTEGTALPLRDGIRIETEAFMNLAGGDHSKRLIDGFFAARKK